MVQGTGVSPGIGIAPALLLKQAVTHDYVPRKSEKPAAEIERFERALERVRSQNDALREKAALRFTHEDAAIFDAYSLMLLDEDEVIRPTRELIRLRSLSAEYAVTLRFGELARSFLEMEDEYMRQRAEDVFNIRDELLRAMMGVQGAEASHFGRPTIVVANTLSPADIATIDLSRLEGIICEEGGYSSHMSILSRTLGIPAVVNLPDFLDHLHDGDTVALDGSTGEVWVNPSEEEIASLAKRSEELFAQRAEAQMLRGRPTITTDGRRIELSANIGQMEEIAPALEADAEAIGMFRTEMLHISHPPMATEEEQFVHYRALLDKVGGKAITVRTYDNGGNRPVMPRAREERNPAIGYRGVRLCLSRPSFFRAQLRALLRASAFGSLKIMVPMVSSLDELREVKKAVESIKAELRREGIRFDEELPLGLLVSVPSSVLMIEVLAPEVDFLSVNLNDLIQFTIAVDRTSPDLGYLYHMYHPAVLRMVKWVVDAAHHHGMSCTVCGEAAGYEQVLPVLTGLGVDGFSVNPSFILSSRKILNACNYSQCKRLADEVLQMKSYVELEKRLQQYHKSAEGE